MRHIDPATVSHGESHRYLLSGVAPRPIAFVGTLDAEGRPNLSPFSFFNAFGANPPTVAFSPAFRGSDGSPKHTFLNIKATGEFTISAVTYAMVEQISLASGDFPAGVDEWVKAGFTKLPSMKIKAPGVAESPFVMECKLLQHVPLGTGPAAGNLMIGEVVMFHIKESVFDGKYMSADRMDLVARMGGPLYCRASGDAIFELAKPSHVGIGFDALPDDVRNSTVLTGNDLARLAGVATLPDRSLVAERWSTLARELPATTSDDFELELRAGNPERALEALLARSQRTGQTPVLEDYHRLAQEFLRANQVERAWECVLAPHH